MTLEHLPVWAISLAWTALTLGIAYALGHVLKAYVVSRLMRLAKRTSGAWDDIVVAELGRRIPFWCFLIGAWLSIQHWAFGEQSHVFATRLLSALGVASVTFAAASIATRLVTSSAAAARPAVTVSGLTLNLVRIVITMLGLLVIIKGLGQDITPMLTALGVGGLAVALALQEPLSNLFAGLFVSLAGQLRIGDYVRLDSGAEGQIADFNWRETRLHTSAGNMVVVPNAKLAQAVVSNFSRPTLEHPVVAEAAVDYASDLVLVERLALEVAQNVLATVPGGVKSFEPVVRFHTFTDTTVRFNVVLRATQFGDQFLLRHETLKRLHGRFVAEGVALPAHVRFVAARDQEPPPPAS